MADPPLFFDLGLNFIVTALNQYLNCRCVVVEKFVEDDN